MLHTQHRTGPTDIKTPVRNRYFYGKLLDVMHFELEQDYFNRKRWLLNRLISGYGVVCGLDVQVTGYGKEITVLPGVALDKWGREIIVPKPHPNTLPAPTLMQPPMPEQRDICEELYLHVCLCYHECESDPVPALGGDCETAALCAPSSIRERYEIIIKDGRAPDIDIECPIADVISGGRINYRALARRVTQQCPDLPKDPCIPLANIRVPPSGDEYDSDDIDISVRPIVYTNDRLFELILGIMGGGHEHGRGGKR